MDVIDRLKEALGQSRVFDRPLDRYALASDASFYSLVPLVVVRPETINDILAIFRIARETRVPLTFRAAGTSLSGQAVTDGILVDISRSWRSIRVHEEGNLVSAGPAVVGARVNDILKPYGRKMGPDPASLNAAMMGGIVANNSSGMCCGVIHNTYHTLHDLIAVLPNGFRFSPANSEDDARLLREHPGIYEGLLKIRSEIHSDEWLLAKIRGKYKIKNTVGYSLNAFVDFEKPLEILSHLMVGSEGTLGFIAETTLRTIPASPHKLTGLLFFPDVYKAAAAVPSLLDAAAVELMDGASLRSVEDKVGDLSDLIRNLDEHTATLLVEFEFRTQELLQQSYENIINELAKLDMIHPVILTDDAHKQALLWSIRKGLYPAVGSMRKTGSSVLIEDVAVPVDRLADLVVDLRALFTKHGYPEAVLFGHAKDGNMHFVITPDFGAADEVVRYSHLMNDVVELVTKKYGGSLKGEHGTGRNMAPFIEAEWGEHARRIMGELKRLLDPDNICNPGVILNDDPEVHIQNLKSMPPVSPDLDLCTECGYCESRCPSRDLTTTPRQRIVLQRRRVLLEKNIGERSVRNLDHDYHYDGMDTCATDGLCALACPMGIDTGKFVKHLREREHGSVSESAALTLAGNMETLTRSVRFGLNVADAVKGALPILNESINLAKRLVPGLPMIPSGIRAPVPLRPVSSQRAPEFLYFQTCISRSMGGYSGKKRSLGETLLLLAERAGVTLKLPENIAEHCCGMPFASKGYRAAYENSIRSSISMIYEQSDEGRLPVIVDISPCTQTFLNAANDLDRETLKKYKKLKFMDSVDFAAMHLLDRLKITNKKSSVVLHPVCSVRKMGITEDMQKLAAACSDRVTVPLYAGCCGMAGDRGLMYPELVEAAVKLEKDEVLGGNFDGHYSSSRTCEYALEKNTGKEYLSILYLLEEATSPNP